MSTRIESVEDPGDLLLLRHAPEDLTRARLVRLGEGINKVVYASDHWVVKRQRRPSEIIALIIVWKFLKRLEHLLPGGFARRLMEKPGKRIRFLQLVFQVVVLPVPKAVWLATHIGSLWKWHSSREVQGQILADAYLAGTPLTPARVLFPPTRVKVRGWPGWLLVSEAMERVETTLQDRINDLARAMRFDEIENWLERFIEFRKSGWRRGVLSLDPHFKNYGIVGDRIVLLDAGGLTNNWQEIEHRLGREDEVERPHVRLGLEMTLRNRPDIAQRFDERWRAAVNVEAVQSHWPKKRQTAASGFTSSEG
jgi:hypothetical protein